jgi:hypothetical protein
MKTFAILALAAVNCGVLWILSLLAAADGHARPMITVQAVGLAWILCCTVYALKKNARPEGGGVTIAAITLPLGYLLTLGGIELMKLFGGLLGDRPEFTAACRGAGVNYLAQPAAPVRSVAYDWPEGELPPSTNFFEIDGRGNVDRLRWRTPDIGLPASITYIESRCCPHSAPLGEPQPWLRASRGGPPTYATRLTADILVKYRTSEIRLAEGEWPLVEAELTVSDRRDGRLLATLHYALDRQRRRGCGETSPGRMDETAFVSRAVGGE